MKLSDCHNKNEGFLVCSLFQCAIDLVLESGDPYSSTVKGGILGKVASVQCTVESLSLRSYLRVSMLGRPVL